MNIQDYQSKPCLFLGIKSSFALCDNNGTIIQIFPQLDSAKYMLEEYSHGSKIYEVVVTKKGIYSNLGEV